MLTTLERLRLRIFHHYGTADGIYAHLNMGNDDNYVMACYNEECRQAKRLEWWLEKILPSNVFYELMHRNIQELLEKEREEIKQRQEEENERFNWTRRTNR